MLKNYNVLSECRDTSLKSENPASGNCRSESSMVKWLLSMCTIFCLFFAGVNLNAQVNITGAGNTSPAMSSSYPTLAAAIADVNNRTAISGPVTISLTAAQTSPAGGYVLNNTAITGGSDTNRFIFDGGSNTITAPNPAGTSGALNDAIFKVVGADFITIQNFVMNENASNTTTTAASNNMVEWGVALLYSTTTNGAQGIVIQGNTITLNRTYQNTFGIYSNSTHSATSITTVASATTAAGANSNTKIYSNAISNVNMGIVIVGPTAAADANTGIEIGGTGLGNNITNFGTTGTFSGYASVSGTVNGILIRNSNGFSILNNTIASSNGGVTAGTLNGIQQPAASATPTGTFTNNINGNNISLRSATTAMNGINIPSGSASTTSNLNINGNDFNTFGHTAAASSNIQFIVNASTHLNTSISNNTFTNISVNTTGSVNFVVNALTVAATGVMNINGNAIVTGFNKTGAGGTVTFFSTNASSVNGSFVNMTNNILNGITLTGATGFTGINNTDGASASSGPLKTITDNQISLAGSPTGTINPITVNFSGPNSTVSNNTVSNMTVGAVGVNAISLGSSNQATLTVAGNTVSNISTAGTQLVGIICSAPTVNVNSNTVTGLSCSGAAVVAGIGVLTGTTSNVFKNTVSDLSSSNAGSTVSGLLIQGGTTVNVYNNRVGDLRAPVANLANPINGINVTGGTAVNVSYNTVNLAASSSGALFGSSAVFASSTPTVTLNNNVFVNNSVANGAGLSVAYRRSSPTLTSYGSGSDRNDYFAPTIYTDGTTPQATIAAFKALVATRDANSISVNPNFLSTASGNANFLKVDPSIASQLESGGANIAGITDDFEATIRQGNPGYLTQVNGGGTAPDLGADEFDGIPSPICNGTPDSSTINGAAAVCNGTGTTLSLSNLYTALGIQYQWSSGTTPGGPYPTTLGTGATQATGNLTTTTYYVCTITCTNSGLSFTTAEKEVFVNSLPTVSVSPNTGTICIPGGSPITLTASGASTYTWSPATGLSATTGSVVIANPSATTTYTVTGTDGNGCVNTATAVITVSPVPNAVLISPATPNICSGATQMLTATGGGNSGTSSTIGTGTAFTGATAEQTAFCNRRVNYVGQTIYTAAELSAAGLVAGNITAMAYNISTNGDATTNANFTVKIGHEGSTTTFASTAFLSNASYTTCYGPATYTHAAPGWQVITFTTPFVWNGVDNICVDVRHDGIDSINNARTEFTTTAGNSSIYGFNSPASGTLSTTRLNIRFDYLNPATNIVWSPITDLYTDAGATAAYTGTATDVVYAKPATTQSYTATSTNAAGCQTPGNVTVTVSSGASISADPVATAACTGATASFTVTASGPSLGYQWRKGGNPLSNGGNISGTDTATLTISNVSPADVDTYDVVVSSSCGSPVTSLGAALTVNPLPAAVTASGAGTFCSNATITASNGGDGTIYFQGTTTGGTSTTTASSSEVVTASGTYYFRARSAAGCWGPEGSVAVVIETPPGITGTNALVCQGASGTIAAVAANNCISLLPSGTTLSGAWTVDSPSADRPSSTTNSATCGFSSGTLRNYDSKTFQVSVAGTYTFEMNDNLAYDGMGYLVSGAFVPGSCATGTFIKGDDDSGADNEPVFTAVLTPGVDYTLIATNWDTAVLENTYGWTITPPAGGELVTPTPGNIQWYTAASGGSPIGSGSPFNPVGVAGSGLADTNTVGTTTYYAACSSATSCRTAVDFVIAPNVTNPTTTITSCGPYTWPANGQVYTTSGSYTTTNNCITDNLVLTVNPFVAHNTNTGLNYCSIQSAINDAATLSGHTITIEPGTYSEQVLVNKGVTITSVGPAQAEINFTGTVTGKPTLFDVSADNVTINNIHFNVDLSKLKSAIIASAAALDNIVITNNIIDAYGTPAAGTYGDRNAVSVNYGGPTNYRVASGGVNNITFTGNTVNGSAPASFFRSGIATDESGGTFSGNTLQSINHDVISRFGNNGNISITGNNCNGGGVEVVEMNGGAGTLTISGNNFNGTFANIAAPGSAVLRLQNNYNAKTTVVNNNVFTNHQWAVMLSNYNTVTLDGNTFTPASGSTTYHHVAIDTKAMSSNSASIVQVPVGATLTNNTFNGSGAFGGTALSFHNNDSDNASFGAFTIGTAGNENIFNDSIARNIYLDNQTGTSSGSTFPAYTSLIGSGAGALTTMALWSTNINAENNKFNVGSGMELPSAMSLANLYLTEDRIQHKIDLAGLGFVLVKANNDYVTTNSFVAPASTSASIQRGINAASSGYTVNVAPGNYAENIIVNQSVTISGPNATNSGCGTRVAEAVVTTSSAGIAANEIFHVAASNVTITGLTIDGDNPAITSGFTSTNGADIDAAEGVTVYETGINNLTVTNNIIKNLSYFGVTLYDYPAGVPSSGHVIANNKIQDMGTYDAGSGIDFWGGGVLLYNNQYAAVTNNCMDNVRIGLQTGNYFGANPGAAAVISDNTMTNVRRRGIMYNLHYASASPFTISGNSISGAMNANETNWDGILIGSQSVASTFTGNNVDGSAITNPSGGIVVWNVKNTTPAAISGGTITGVSNGVFVNNYDGYPTTGSDAPDGGAASLSGMAISSCATGIRVKDNTLSGHAAVSVSIGSGMTVTGGTSGLVVENASASAGASLSDMAFSSQSGAHITLINNANAIDATSATFNGSTGAAASVAQNLAIEDKIVHKIDNGALGFVTVKANNTFVTTNSFVAPATTIANIQRGVDAASNGFTVNVGPGSFNNDVVVNKQVTVLGDGAGSSIVSGPIGGGGSTFQIAASGAILDGLTITRDGNNVTDWNNPGLNTAGVSVQGQTVSGEVRNCEITGMRTGIDINNSNGNNIHNNNIHFNRTGMIFRNQTDNTIVVNNIIDDNWTAGVLFLDASGGTNSPVQTAANSSFNNNRISGNWYGEIVDRQAGGSLPAAGSNLKNFTCNWYGAIPPVVSTLNSSEPGYAAQIPVAYGGTAVAPGGQPDILGPGSANFTYAPFAVDGTDLGGIANDGFQPTAACSAPCALVLNMSATETSCPSNTNGTASVSVTGGSGSYTYSWSNGGTSDSISGLTSGTYTVTVTDLNGCVASNSIAVTSSLAGPVHNTDTGLNYCNIQSAINAAATLNGHTITVDAGTYAEDVLVNKDVTIIGAGIGSSIVSGPIGGGGATFQVASGNVIIEGFTITRAGNNTTDWNNPGLNTAGVAVQGLTSKVELRYCEITGMRTGIDINNSNGNNIHNNNIHFNRTGMIFRNQTDNTVVTNNFITDNWTGGIVFLDASGGTNSPVQSAANSSFNDNNISGNWYAQIVERQVGGSLPAAGSNLKNFTCNWYGTTSPVITTANSTEPGYAAQIPVAYGGTATAPGGQPDIAGAASANIVYAPLAISGVDLGGITNDGWQPSAACSAPCDVVVTATPTAIVCPGGNSTVTVSATGGSGTYTSGTGTFTVTAGTYTYTVTDLNGCVASTTITISDPAPSVHTTTVTACDTYTWAAPLGNGQTYTTSQTGITNVSTNEFGCPHTETLNLTINNSTTNGTMTVSNVGPYTWAGPLGSGLTYTTSGVYTFTTTNAAGCPNVATLTLTVLPVNTFLIGSSCGATLSALTITVQAPWVAGNPTYTFKITNLVTNAVLIINRPVNSLALSNYAGITLGTPYDIQVSTNGGATYTASCTINTPSPTSTIGAQCGTTLTSMGQFVYATYATTITGYRFRVTNNTTNAVYVYDALSGQNRFSFSQLPPAFVSYSTTYSVQVALQNTDGSYLPYGTACNITTPAFPTSELILSQCDIIANSNTQTLNATIIAGATGYRFQLTNAAQGYNLSLDRSVNNFTLGSFPGLLPGTTYTVRVAVRINGVWGPLTGKPCNVTTPGNNEGGTKLAEPTNVFAAVAYPNPFAENFMFDVQTSTQSSIQIKVYDMLGKQVENRNVEVTDVNNIHFGDNYPSGVYNVIITQGENTKTLRVIKR